MKKLSQVLGASFVFSVKILSRALYHTEEEWITPKEEIQWGDVRLAIILNHTSLFEPLFLSAIPYKNLWRAVGRAVVPVADVTMERPILGRLFRMMVPNIISISRKRDETWEQILNSVKGNSLILIFPEGRMMRKGGLDKHGQPMSVKGGVADIIGRIDKGKIMIAYSGGLHHVQAPGEKVPKIFQSIKVKFEQIDVNEYKKKLDYGQDGKAFRQAVISDLESRMDLHCPRPQV